MNCNSQKYTIDNLPEKQLVFGKGGGITGAIDTYILLENGQLFFNSTLTNSSVELPRVKKKLTKECFLKLKDLKLETMNFDHPGNMYYFIEEMEGEAANKVVWGSHEHSIEPACVEFYEQLRTLIK